MLHNIICVLPFVGQRGAIKEGVLSWAPPATNKNGASYGKGVHSNPPLLSSIMTPPPRMHVSRLLTRVATLDTVFEGLHGGDGDALQAQLKLIKRLFHRKSY